MRRKKITEEDVINKWLGDYHNTSLEQILKENPEWNEDPQKYTRVFYDKYRVTQAQHDEWHDWMIDAIAKSYKMSKRYTKRSSWTIYLNTAPSITQP